MSALKAKRQPAPPDAPLPAEHRDPAGKIRCWNHPEEVIRATGYPCKECRSEGQGTSSAGEDLTDTHEEQP